MFYTLTLMLHKAVWGLTQRLELKRNGSKKSLGTEVITEMVGRFDWMSLITGHLLKVALNIVMNWPQQQA